MKYREERLRDLGGLLLEMFRRDRFREDLVRERCQELLEVDDHLAALDSLLGLSWTPPEPARCACGAPLGEDARFCAACGRSIGPATRQCAACGSALTEDAAFCMRCGLRTDARAVRQAQPAAEIEAAGEGDGEPEPAAEAAES
jgi:predicted nucleic acid-binding Zn ribbon protein